MSVCMRYSDNRLKLSPRVSLALSLEESVGGNKYLSFGVQCASEFRPAR